MNLSANHGTGPQSAAISCFTDISGLIGSAGTIGTTHIQRKRQHLITTCSHQYILGAVRSVQSSRHGRHQKRHACCHGDLHGCMQQHVVGSVSLNWMAVSSLKQLRLPLAANKRQRRCCWLKSTPCILQTHSCLGLKIQWHAGRHQTRHHRTTIISACEATVVSLTQP